MTSYRNDRFNSESYDEAMHLDIEVPEVEMPEMVIDSFKGAHSFLSNFAPATIVPTDGFSPAAPTVEHAFQACKTTDPDQQIEILTAATPGQAKRLGRICQMRPDWDDIKLGVMAKLLAQKFAMPGSMAQRLIDTAPALLVEGNNWGDTYWGVCEGTGENMLGRLLMERRDLLISQLPTMQQAVILDRGPSVSFRPTLIEW